MIAALYVETNGAYIGLPGVDAWDEPRDARKYAGPHPIVAHPPCQRWGRFWHGSTRKPHQFALGDDGGCFAHALETLERCGGVLEQLGDGLDMMVGIRADEQRRVSKMRNGKNSESTKITNTVPLADAGITVAEVGAFWKAQPFDLELSTFNGRTLAGNCDLCFLKPAAQVQSLIAERPERAVWWIAQEAHAKKLQNNPASQGIRFRWDRPSYAQMAVIAADQGDFFNHDEEAIACFCGD